MYTTKRFTPAVLDRFRRQERGQGTYSHYLPWHRVSRGDPSSIGRSHLTWRQGRHYELLSDIEQIVLFFVLMVAQDKDDIREQFPLSQDPEFHEVGDYDCRYALGHLPGTQQIAERLCIKHPMTHGGGRSEPWVMSTDFLVTFLRPGQPPICLAISVKTASDAKKRRTRQLFEIEQAYWDERGVEWLLITPEIYDHRVAKFLALTKPWALGTPVSDEEISSAADTILNYQGASFKKIWMSLTRTLGDSDLAQRAIWQSAWFGHAPVDLRRGWRPHLPLPILPRAEYASLNPVASLRSAKWN